MPIKKLQNNVDELKLHLAKDEGVLFFKKEGDWTCLILTGEIASSFDKLDDFHPLDELKYLGSEGIYKQLVVYDHRWGETHNKVFSKNDLDFIYRAQSGKLSYDTTNVKKRVLIVDDSKTIQKMLSHTITKSDDFMVMATADHPLIAKEIIEKQKPDLITLDMEMPHMTGLEFLKTYLGKKKIPTVLITSLSKEAGTGVIEALANGALTYVQKPAANRLGKQDNEVINALQEISKYKYVDGNNRALKALNQFKETEGMILIGSSTGGTVALQEIFCALPAQIPPILVVQHIPAVFSAALAHRLNTLCPFTIKEAEDGETIERNHIYIAPGGKQMAFSNKGGRRKIVITDDPPVNKFKPSVDYLFDSVAASTEDKLLGIILTGMGRDGAKGLLELKNNNALTIAQDEATSVVFGMPKEAIAIGAANKIVPLDKMAIAIVDEFNKL